MSDHDNAKLAAGIRSMEDQIGSAAPLTAGDFFLAPGQDSITLHFFDSNSGGPKHLISISIPKKAARALGEALISRT